MPGPALVVVESELVLGGLKTVLDRPPMAFDRHQRFDRCCRWHQVVKKRDRRRRYDDGSADRVSKGPDLRRLILRPDRPVRIAPIMQPRSFDPGPC